MRVLVVGMMRAVGVLSCAATFSLELRGDFAATYRGARGGARERRVRGLRRRGSGLGEHEPLRRGVPAVRGRAQTPRRARE